MAGPATRAVQRPAACRRVHGRGCPTRCKGVCQDCWVNGRHAGPVGCKCIATAQQRAPQASHQHATHSRARGHSPAARRRLVRGRCGRRAPAGCELAGAGLDRLCRVDERAVGHAAGRLHLARAKCQAGARTRWQLALLPWDHAPQPVPACAPLSAACQLAHHWHVALEVQRLRTWPSMVGSQSCAAS